MTPEEKERYWACLQEISSILYQNTPSEEIETLEGIEITVRQQTLAQISPKIALFFIEKQTGTRTPPKGRKRTVKSWVGSLKITKKQANRLGLAPYQRRSPLLSRCCLILSANSSYQGAENDLKILTGIAVSHSSLQRQVQRHSLDFPDVKQKLTVVIWIWRSLTKNQAGTSFHCLANKREKTSSADWPCKSRAWANKISSSISFCPCWRQTDPMVLMGCESGFPLPDRAWRR